VVAIIHVPRQDTLVDHNMGHLTTKFKCIIYIQNVYILKQEVTGIMAIEAGITFFMSERSQHKVNM